MHEKNGRWFAQRFKLHPSYAVAYTRCITDSMRPRKMPEKNVAQGIISDKAHTRIMDAVQWLLFFSDKKTVYSKKHKKHFTFRLAFITLSISSTSLLTDNYILEHLFQPFLKWMSHKHNAINYIWKAEIQPKRYYERGERCIHFHITINKFIHYLAVRHKWNRLQVAHGLLKEGIDAPSTEIKSVIRDEQIGYYLAKYITKKPDADELKVTCKVWGCNHALSNIKIVTEEESSTTWSEDVRQYLYMFATKKVQHDYCATYYAKIKKEDKFPVTINEQIIIARDSLSKKDDGVLKYYITEDEASITVEKKSVHRPHKIFVEQLKLM